MREMLDCGVLLPPGHDAAMRGWIERHQPQVARALSSLAARERGRGRRTAGAGGHGRDAQALRCLPDAGRAGHAGLDPHRLAAGAAVPGHAHPGAGRRHEGVGHRDLLALGAADFISEPVCLEGLRVRCAISCCRLRGGWRRPRSKSPPCAMGRRARRSRARRPAASSPGAMPAPGRGRESGRKQAARRRPRRVHAWRRPCSTRPWRACGCCPQDGGEPFARAKARVVGEFEREYLRRALSHHGGNVAQAARASSKHRRAFWALMRKHGIEAAPYRIAAARRGQDMPSD